MKLFALLISLVTATGFLGAPAVATAATPATANVVFGATAGGTLQPGAPLVLSGSITNESANTLPAGTATVYLDRNQTTSRDALGDWFDGTDDVAVGKLGSRLLSVPTPTIPSGRTVSVPITVPAEAIGLSAGAGWGVHTLAVQYEASGSIVAQSRSSVVWYPGGDTSTTSLALVYPLTVPAGTTGLIPSATLATYTAPDGLLTRQLEQILGRRSVAVAVDPMIIASIVILGNSAPQTAQDWLQQLRALPNESFPLTYADSDVAAQRQAGVTTLLAPTSFTIDPKLFPGYTVAPTTTPTVTPTPNPTATPIPTVPTLETLTAFDYTPSLQKLVWPSSDTVAEQDLDAFPRYGFDQSILNSANVSYGDLDHTPSAAATVSGHAALVADSQISKLLSAAASATDDVTWQKDVAELSSAIAAVSHQPGGNRSLVATIARGASGDYLRLAETLQQLGSQPWAGFSQLTEVAALTPTTATIASKPEADSRIDTVRTLLASERLVGSFSSILDDPTVLTGERRLSLLAVLANSWNAQPTGWKTAAKTYLASSNKTLHAVNIVRPGSLFVPAESVPIGVSVTNKLQWPVTVNVSLVSPSSVIEVEKSAIPLTVEANSQGKASVPVKALANGEVTVTASLASSTGIPIGSPASLELNVQAGWESALTAVIAAILALVFGFGIYRNIRKRRRQNRDESDETDAGDDTETASGTTSPDSESR